MSRVALPSLQLSDSNRYPRSDAQLRSVATSLSAQISPHLPSPRTNGTSPVTPTYDLNRNPGEMHEADQQQSKLKPSLPSLHEALGGEAALPPFNATAPGRDGHHSLDLSPPRHERPRSSSRQRYHPYHRETVRHQPYSHGSRDGPRHYYQSRGSSPPHMATAHPPIGIPQSSQDAMHTQIPGPTTSAHHWDTAKDPRHVVDPPYGDSVNRHLEIFDLNHALQEIVEHTSVIANFGQSYSSRLHQSQRTGFVTGMLPAISEVDDLVNRSRRTLQALSKARSVLVAQQAAQAREAQLDNPMDLDQQHPQRNDSFDDAKLADGRTRRGRAAPPGRCHSCNRSETPEWRRGPDGARTLCNACGLHYAKLTRKVGAASKHQANDNSGIRKPTQVSA